MSSRALRKAQRLREETEQAKCAPENEVEGEASDEEGEEPIPRAKPNLFAMLNEDAKDEGEDNDDEPISDAASASVVTPKPKTSTAKRRKKKAKTGTDKATTDRGVPRDAKAERLDDIDLALKSLASSSLHTPAPVTTEHVPQIDPELERLSSLLSIDTQHLNADNEMRRLFGREAVVPHDLPADDPQAGQAGGRRRNRRQQQGRHGGAVGGHGLAGGRGLAGLGLRRNIFMTGREEWPRGTGGGLGMELVAQEDDGFTEYRFVHNRHYQDVQSQFESCVESMDPARMLQLLEFNPYHISTILQVSEMARQDRELTVWAGFLERALFSFGRAVHSTFASRLAKGKAGLDFRRPENREFWLAAWRYISNLGMRGTWRTAFEWAKLLLSLDPEGDPYRVRLSIDQFALRARQPQQLIDLHQSTLYTAKPNSAPNILFSLALAHQSLDKDSDTPRRILFQALTSHPFVFARLYQELNIDPAPPSIWASTPRTERETLFTELYATRAKDLWSTPEATALLVEVAGISETALTAGPIDLVPISADEARHVFLTDTPALISLLPRALTSRAGLVSDPVPPADSLPSYTTMTAAELSRHEARASAGDSDDDADAEEARRGIIASIGSGSVRSIISGLLPWLGRSRETPDSDENEAGNEASTEELGRVEGAENMSPQELLELLQDAMDHDEISEEQLLGAFLARHGQVTQGISEEESRLEEEGHRRRERMRELGLGSGDEAEEGEEEEAGEHAQSRTLSHDGHES